MPAPPTRRAWWRSGGRGHVAPTRPGPRAWTRSPSGPSRSTPAPGANLLRVAPAPSGFSYTSLNTYEKCPLQFALQVRLPDPRPDQPKAFFTFGNTAHEAFEAFTRMRRERIARGEAPPTREDLGRLFARALGARRVRRQPPRRPVTRRARGHPAGQLLDRGARRAWARPCREEQQFELVLVPGRRLRARAHLRRHRPHRPAPVAAASRWWTTRPAVTKSQKDVAARTSSSPSTRWPAATRWAWARPRR